MVARFSGSPKADALMTQLSLSVPPEVKNISSGSALMHRAITLLASAKAFFALLEKEYGCEAFA